MGSSYSVPTFPDLKGKTYAITGANCGLGLAAAKIVAKQGAKVFMVGRNPKAGADAVAEVKALVPDADVEWMTCDLGDLDSVKTFANELSGKTQSLTGLLNNAGVMYTPISTRSKQGHEMMLGVNHYGHFALTLLLLPLLRAEKGEARVVTVSSIAAKWGFMHWDDLDAHKSFNDRHWYEQSKLCNLLFMRELQRKLQGTNILSVAAHPGVSHTSLGRHWPTMFSVMGPLMGTKPEQGTLSEVTALIADGINDGDYWGPDGWMEASGMPTNVPFPPLALNVEDGKRLWQLSEKETGVRFPDLK